MIHANGHMICSIDTETTGLNPKKHCIWEIAVIPLNFNLEPDEKYIPFNVEMALSKFEDIDHSFVSKEKIEELESRFNPNTALELFIEWIERLELPHKKRIMPLAHNWPFDRAFIEEWMGPESFNLYIDGQFRDLMSTSVFVNDTDAFGANKYHFPKHNLSYVCNNLGLQCEKSLWHGALYDAMKTAEAYRRLCVTTRCLA